MDDLEGKIMVSRAAATPPELEHGQPITCTARQAKGLIEHRRRHYNAVRPHSSLGYRPSAPGFQLNPCAKR
jgi:putative transposase